MIDQDKIKFLIKDAGHEIELTADDFEKPFSELGFDSLDVFGLLSEIESLNGKSFSDEEYSGLRNLNDVISLSNV